ncbi:hypothetical protein LguiA_028010 [Lonicera macranthoides]
MSIPLVRWRVRDWASCFYACRFPLDEEPERFCCSSIQICKGDDRGQVRDIRGTESSEDRYKQKQQSTKKLNENNDSRDLEEKGNENDDEESRWPSFEEEDYIVFCFEEDGAIHMVKEVKSETSSRSHSRSSRPINRKLSYGENGKQVNNSKHEAMSMSNEEEKGIYPTNEERNSIISFKKGKEKAHNHLNTESIVDETKEVNELEITKECKDVSAESSDSTQTDASTSSFAFPV